MKFNGTPNLFISPLVFVFFGIYLKSLPEPSEAALES